MVRLARGNKTGDKMTLTVDAAQRQSIVPLQQSASSQLAGAFGPRFVTGSLYRYKNIIFLFFMPVYKLLRESWRDFGRGCVHGGLQSIRSKLSHLL